MRTLEDVQIVEISRPLGELAEFSSQTWIETLEAAGISLEAIRGILDCPKPVCVVFNATVYRATTNDFGTKDQVLTEQYRKAVAEYRLEHWETAPEDDHYVTPEFSGVAGKSQFDA